MKIYDEGFVFINGNGKVKEEVHFSEILTLGHRISKGRSKFILLDIKLKQDREPVIFQHFMLTEKRMERFIKLGEIYATWLFRNLSDEEIRKMNLEFGSSLKIMDGMFVYTSGKWKNKKNNFDLFDIKKVEIKNNFLIFELMEDSKVSYIKIKVNEISNFYIIPYIVNRLSLRS